MSGEMAIRAATGKTVKAQAYNADKSKIWNGAAFVNVNTLTEANIFAHVQDLIEGQTSDSVKTGMYVGDFGISIAAQVVVLEYWDFTSGTPTINDQTKVLGYQTLDWTGTHERSFSSVQVTDVSSNPVWSGAPSTATSGFLQRMEMLYRRFLKKHKKDGPAGELVCFEDDGSTVKLTSAYTDSGGVTTVDAAT